MIKLLNFTIKVIATILVLLMCYINGVIIILFWDGKYMVAPKILDIIWGLTDEEKLIKNKKIK